jgi:hypothetical protein
MKATDLKINLFGKESIVTIQIYDMCVIISTNIDNYKRSTSYSSIEEAIKNTTLNPVREFLKSI